MLFLLVKRIDYNMWLPILINNAEKRARTTFANNTLYFSKYVTNRITICITISWKVKHTSCKYSSQALLVLLLTIKLFINKLS